jgi:hypothetical protein
VTRKAEPEAEPLADVYLTVGVRTSDGPGPGYKRLPQREANLLVARKLAVAGTEPPRSFLGEAEPSTRRFDDNTNARGSRDDAGLRR